jgi:Flp pilus assembly secretin CpaC
MSVAFDRFGPSGRLVLLVAALLLGAVSSTSAQDRNPGTIIVSIDQAQMIRLPDGVATLVVGNPLIADISIQAGGMAVLTGKGYGVTNLIALDRSGTVLEQRAVQVQAARDAVVVYRGAQKESYSCTPTCERRITLGDNPEYFGTTLGQSTARTGQAQGAGAAAASGGPPRP